LPKASNPDLIAGVHRSLADRVARMVKRLNSRKKSSSPAVEGKTKAL